MYTSFFFFAFLFRNIHHDKKTQYNVHYISHLSDILLPSSTKLTLYLKENIYDEFKCPLTPHPILSDHYTNYLHYIQSFYITVQSQRLCFRRGSADGKYSVHYIVFF